MCSLRRPSPWTAPLLAGVAGLDQFIGICPHCDEWAVFRKLEGRGMTDVHIQDEFERKW